MSVPQHSNGKDAAQGGHEVKLDYRKESLEQKPPRSNKAAMVELAGQFYTSSKASG